MSRRVMHIDVELIQIIRERAQDYDLLEPAEKMRLEKYKRMPCDRLLVERVIHQYIRARERKNPRGDI